MSEKVALVTGASRGLGAALAVALARDGYAVVCAARATRRAPQETAGTIDDVVDRIRAVGGTAVGVRVDVSDRSQVADVVARTIAEFGRLDVLVNNAATGTVGGIDVSLPDHDLVMAVNLDAPFIASRQAVPHMRALGEGRILNVSSFVALRAVPTTSSMSYGMAKLAVERLTVDLAKQVKPDGIAVNCFRVDTPIASEGAAAHMRIHAPEQDLSSWIPSEVAAEGPVWMLQQPVTYTGQLESMRRLAQREHIMPAVAAWPGPPPPTTFPT